MRRKYRLLNYSNITKVLHVGISSILAIFRNAYIERAWNKVTAISLDIEHITCKESIELVIEKNK